MRFRFPLAASLMVLLAVQCASAAEPSPALKAVIAAAKTEGHLDLSWLPSLIVDDGVKQLVAGMNAMFGTSIAYTFTPDPGSVPRNLNKILVAAQAHQPSPSDVFIGTTNHILIVEQRKAVIPVDWTALLPDRITDQTVEAHGLAVRIFTTLPGGILYNTKLAPERPEYLTDLLKPEWKGKIASNPYAASFDNLASADFWGPERTLDFARKFSAQLSGLIGCPDIERIASGEFIAFAMDCTGRDWVKFHRDGAPVDMVVPKDYAAQRYYYLSIPVNAAHPNAAKLFVVYGLTSEGQKIIWNHDDTDLHTFPDSGMAKVVAGYEKDGVHFKELSVTWLEKEPDLRSLQEQVIKMLQRN
jgi:ABC-type Fe3+ transport system substrate-binding protein